MSIIIGFSVFQTSYVCTKFNTDVCFISYKSCSDFIILDLSIFLFYSINFNFMYFNVVNCKKNVYNLFEFNIVYYEKYLFIDYNVSLKSTLSHIYIPQSAFFCWYLHGSISSSIFFFLSLPTDCLL